MPLPLKNNVLPWLHDVWEKFQTAQRLNRLAHAYLLVGQEGIGKYQFADAVASSLLCSDNNADGFACGHCKDCLLVNAQSHPDFVLITPEEGSQVIKVDQVRQLINFSTKTAQGFRVVVISPAEAMNISAANALLKTLEEPGKNTYLFLISHQPSQLPATIRSRCQILKITPPTMNQSIAWMADQVNADQALSQLALNLAQNAPFKAVELLDSGVIDARKDCFKLWLAYLQKKISIITVVEKFQEIDFKIALYHYTTWVMDLIKIKLGCVDAVINSDLTMPLSQVADNQSLLKLYAHIDKLNEIKNLLARKINLNEQMLLEDIFLSF